MRAITFESSGGIPADIDTNTLSGNARDGLWIGGPLLQSATWEDRGYPIVPTGVGLTVGSDATLNLEAGLTFKTTNGLIVNGTLNSNGTNAEPIVFTSLKDDSVDGDTNNDGSATSPAPGQWGSIHVSEAGTGHLDHTDIRYGGYTSYSGDNAAVAFRCACPGSAITNSSITDSAGSGVRVWTGGSPTITDNELADNGYSGGSAVDVVAGGSPEIARNHLVDNWGGIYYSASYLSPGGAINIHDNVVEGTDDHGGSGTAAAAIWVSSSSQTVQPISLGGNTVDDNHMRGIDFNNRGGVPIDIDSNSLSGNDRNGLWLSGPLLQSTTWEDRGYPMVPNSDGLRVASGAALTMGPGLMIKSDFARGVTVDGTLNTNGTAADPVVFTSLQDDSIGGDTNGDGTASSPAPGQWYSLHISETGSAHIDHADVRYAGFYSYGGDFASVAFRCTCPGSEITHSTVSDGAGSGVLVWTGGSPTITDNTFTDNGSAIDAVDGGSPEIGRNNLIDNGSGISYSATYLPGSSGAVNIHDNDIEGTTGSYAAISVSSYSSQVSPISLGGNTITNNSGKAIDFLNASGVPVDLDTNTLTGNAENGVWVGGTVLESATWEDRGYPFVLANGGLRVGSGSSLNLGAGMTFKSDAYNGVIVDGTLNASGTPGAPVTFTSVTDDSVDGDTNGDGFATTPASGQWGTLTFTPNAGAGTGGSMLDHLAMRYGGYSSYPFYSPAMFSILCPCPRPPAVSSSRMSDTSEAIYLADNAGPTLDGSPIASDVVFADISSYAIRNEGQTAISSPRDNFDGALDGPRPMGHGPEVKNVSTDPLGDSADDNCSGVNHQCPKGGDPVALSTGAMNYSHTDLSLPNIGDEDLEFVRTYNSRATSDTGLGRGWSQTGLMRATELGSGDVLVRRTDGRQDVFVKDGSDYLPPSGVHDDLTKRLDGSSQLDSLDRSTYSFNAHGRIETITDDHGLVVDYTYNSAGRLSSIVDPSGQSLTFSYNGTNRISQVTDSTGRNVAFTYTSTNELATATDALGKTTTYGYDAKHRLMTITDPRGVTFLTNNYDSQGRIVSQVDGDGNVWGLDYGTGQTTVTDPEGGQSTFAFDGLGRIGSETDQLGHTTSYSYDATGNVDAITRPGGATTNLAYDAKGNLLSSTDPEGGDRTYDYDSRNRLIAFTDERNKTWTYDWNGSDDLVEITDPDSETTDVSYDGAGLPTAVTDPNGHTMAYDYDSRGNPTSLETPLGDTTTLGYDSFGNVTSKALPGLAPETYTHNALGDLLTLTTPEGHQSSFDYDPNGALTAMTDPASNVWTIEHDDMELPTAYVDPLAQRTELSYDGNQNLTSVTDRRNKTTSYGYDAANRLSEVDAPDTGPWSFGYDVRGNRDSVTDPRGNETHYEFDLADRLIEADEPLSTQTNYGYNPAGDLTSLTDPNGHTTTFAYDDLRRLSLIDQPLSKQTTFGYDPAGNLTSRATSVDQLAMTYDDSDRLTQISDGTNPLRTFAYDPASRLTDATDAQSKTIELTYDDDGNLTGTLDGRGQSSARSFDSRGNLTSQTDGRGSLSYSYDELDRMSGLTDPQSQAIGFDYDAEGNLTETSLPNGATTSSSYDGAGRILSTATSANSTLLQSFDYGYDLAGNRVSSTDRNGDETGYGYDALNRLVELDLPSAPAVDYGYDDAGNRTEAGPATYGYNALNELTTDSLGTDYSYDGAGRLVEEDSGSAQKTYAYDAMDQLLAVDDGSDPISYSYDAFGRRSERIEALSAVTAHYSDLSDAPTLDTDSSGVIKSFLHGPTSLLEEQTSAGTTYPLTDAHNDVVTRADQSGTVSSRASYDPWGNQASGPQQEMGWLGGYERRSDPGAGLVAMGARTYIPEIGRFSSEDRSLGYQLYGQSLDRMAYAWNNPLNMYDLTGRSIFDDIAATAAQIVTHPGDSTTAAVDYWSHSDSTAADILGPLAIMGDLATHPTRLDDYMKNCNGVRIGTGVLVTYLTIPAAAAMAEAAGAAASAASIGEMFGAGSAAASATFMAGTVGLLGPYISSKACTS